MTDSQPFTSEIDLKEKIEKQLKSGGLEWGVNGNELVVTLVNKLTCVGLIPEGGLSVDKVLSKGGYSMSTC